MKNKYGNVLWGIALIIAGLGLTGKYLLGWDFDIFFDGWWTLFIIIAALASMIDSGVHTSNVFCLFFGIMLFLSCQKALPGFFSWKLILPLIFIFIGITIIISAFSNKPTNIGGNHSEPAGEWFNSSNPNLSASFCRRYFVSDSEFSGCTTSCSFGSIGLDLRNAIIKQNCLITIHNSFGQTQILLPPNTNVTVLFSPSLGSINNYYKNNVNNPAFPTVIFQGDCSFGEVVIK